MLALAVLAADVAYVLLPRARRQVAANLRPALAPAASPARLRQAVRGVFRTAALNYLALFRLPALSSAAVAARVSIRHVERLHAALAGGKGVVVVTAHLGPFDAVTHLAAALRLPVMVPVEPIEPPALRDFVTRLRATHGMRFLPLGTAVLREAVRALRRGEIVTLALDRDVLGGGVPLPFFGRLATFQEGPAVLAARTGAVILPIFATRRGLAHAEVLVEEPVALVRDERGAVDVRATLR
ncbi:MAG: lysophospholipid acyltransferase family protein, partial [Chloroflexi bacterium]|nr:lysophospholipid acyltransferase family protein [Chloroflexota bacterium]